MAEKITNCMIAASQYEGETEVRLTFTFDTSAGADGFMDVLGHAIEDGEIIVGQIKFPAVPVIREVR